MNSRALLLIGAVLASSAWAQEPAANSPALSRQVFDLSNDSIKKIVRDSAATQSAPVYLSSEKPVKREPLANIEFAPRITAPVAARAQKSAPPRPTLDTQTSDLLSALFDALVDLADDSPSAQYTEWRHCPSHDGLKPTTPGYVMCAVEKR